MSKSKKKKETKAVIAGQIAFWVSFLGIISLPIPGFWRFVGGFAIASGLKKLIETMATPLDGLHTENGEKLSPAGWTCSARLPPSASKLTSS